MRVEVGAETLDDGDCVMIELFVFVMLRGDLLWLHMQPLVAEPMSHRGVLRNVTLAGPLLGHSCVSKRLLAHT